MKDLPHWCHLPEGAVVRVSHFRKYSTTFGTGVFTAHEANLLGFSNPPLGHGGETVVWIDFAGGSKAYGVAKCNPADNYDRKAGTIIALRRAYASAIKRGLISL